MERLGRTATAVGLTLCAAAVAIGGHHVWQTHSDHQRPALLHAGRAVVIVESHNAYNDANGHGSIGTGIGGTLGLVGGSCVGFVNAKDPDTSQVIIWPPGTTIAGTGADLQITSEGMTVRLGDHIEAGADLRRDFPELDDTIPPQCSDYPRVPVGLDS